MVIIKTSFQKNSQYEVYNLIIVQILIKFNLKMK